MTIPQTHIPKDMYFQAIETIDTCKPSRLFVWVADPQEEEEEEQESNEGDSWALCVSDDESEYRIVTAQELRTVFLKALAYDELMEIKIDND